MITKVKIKEVATYKDIEVLPKKVNYIYGGNGTGKTTLSRFINNGTNITNGNLTIDSPDCEIITYNKDFVDKNFGDNSAIQGIFTIGEDSKEIEEKIQTKIKEKLNLDESLKTKEKSIDAITNELLKEKEIFENKCWLVKKANEQFYKCFTGYRDAKEKFAEMCLNSFANNKEVTEFKDIEESYRLLYESDLKTLEKFDLINVDNIDTIEQNKIFSTAIVCISNNEYSELISNLKNSDWVMKGLEFMQQSNKCPFCQQKLDNQIKDSLLEVFDDTYNNQLKELSKAKETYINLTKEVENKIKTIINCNIDIIDTTKLTELQLELSLIIKENLQKLKNKENSPSDKIDLKSLSPIIDNINVVINTFNEKIEKNNSLALNQKTERDNLSKVAWSILANNLLYDDILAFLRKRNGINTGTFNLKQDCERIKKQILDLQDEIHLLQSTTSTIENAITEVNKILLSFSFTGFKLEKAQDNRNYKIIRADGSDVRETLSEGEQRFITFLYFYQLIKGNIDGKSSTKRKIIVIDDPISSLDSNILFIVSTLVKTIIADCLSGNSLIDQVFILTHNIYFHQEVAFKSARESISSNECFWIIRKKDNISNIEISDKNKIQTSYELLWQEVRDTSKSSTVSIFNTLRRILEYYFNIIGHLDYEACINNMHGEDKLLCKSLLAFINVNSHLVNDDFVVIYDEDSIDKYIRVFEKIFEYTGHKAHYNMMMQIKE